MCGRYSYSYITYTVACISRTIMATTVLLGEEVNVLLSVWGEEKVQHELDGPTRKVALHKKIAENPRERGFNRDGAKPDKKFKTNV